MPGNTENGNSFRPWPDHPLFAAESGVTYQPGSAKKPDPKKNRRTVSVRRPGEKGTLDALREYGDRLVCVRYLKDGIRGKRYKTIEIIVHEADWTPSAKSRKKALPNAPAALLDPHRIVIIRISSADAKLRADLRAAGGQWDPAAKLWRIPYGAACQLALDGRILTPEEDFR